MKRAEIITLFTLFASVFVLVGVLRYLNLYEGMELYEGLEPGEEEEEKPEGEAPNPEPPMLEGLDVPAAPPSAPASGGPAPAAAGAAGSVLKFSAF
jgi:hypothetical protein